jgi:hypothetical protein
MWSDDHHWCSLFLIGPGGLLLVVSHLYLHSPSFSFLWVRVTKIYRKLNFGFGFAKYFLQGGHIYIHLLSTTEAALTSSLRSPVLTRLVFRCKESLVVVLPQLIPADWQGLPLVPIKGSINFLLFPSRFNQIPFVPIKFLLFLSIITYQYPFVLIKFPNDSKSNSSCSHQVPIKIILFPWLWSI